MNKQEIIDRLEISRERLQYDAERYLHGGNEFMEYGCNCEISGIDKAIYLIQQLTNGWIPVSERLPDKYGLYIVSVHYSDWICDYGTEDEVYKEPEDAVLMAEYRKAMNDDHKWYLHEEDGDTTINGNEKVYDKPDYWSTYIKAWQPLPEPFKEVSHD